MIKPQCFLDKTNVSPTVAPIDPTLPARSKKDRSTGLGVPFLPVTKIEKTDPIWSIYTNETQMCDKDMLEAWSNSMDVLLVFAGLFLAILTAFLIKLHKDLKIDPAGTANELLFAVVRHLDSSVGNMTSPQITPFLLSPFTPSHRSIRVIGHGEQMRSG